MSKITCVMMVKKLQLFILETGMCLVPTHVRSIGMLENLSNVVMQSNAQILIINLLDAKRFNKS